MVALLVRNAGLASIGRVISGVGTLSLCLYLSAVEFGYYTAIYSVSSLLFILARSGSHEYLLVRGASRQKKPLLGFDVVAHRCFLVMLLSLAICLIVGAVYRFPQGLQLALLAAGISTRSYVEQGISAVLTSQSQLAGNYSKASLNSLLAGLAQIFTVGLGFLLGADLGGVALAGLIMFGTAGILMWIFREPADGRRPAWGLFRSPLKRICFAMGQSRFFLLSEATAYFYTGGLSLLAVAFGGADSGAQFALPASVYNSGLIIPATIYQYFLPRLIADRSNRVRSWRTTMSFALLLIAVGALGFLGLWYVFPALISHLFSAEFSGSGSVAQFLALSYFVHCLLFFFSARLVVEGLQEQRSKIQLCVSVVGLGAFAWASREFAERGSGAMFLSITTVLLIAYLLVAARHSR